jgi:hypothetical protein
VVGCSAWLDLDAIVAERDGENLSQIFAAGETVACIEGLSWSVIPANLDVNSNNATLPAFVEQRL